MDAATLDVLPPRLDSVGGPTAANCVADTSPTNTRAATALVPTRKLRQRDVLWVNVSVTP